MQDPDIAMVGCGNMGAALAAGYLTAVPHGRLLAIDPDVPRSRTLLPKGASVRIEASIEALDAVIPGMVVLAVKPQMMAGMLPALARLPGSKGLVVSIAAGIGVATLRAHLPEARIVRAMPNTPALVGEGFTALFGEPSVGADDRARCGTLFDAVGTCRWVADEAAIDKVTAVSGSGPAYFAFLEAVIEAGEALGLDRALVNEMARATMAGASAMLRDPRSDPGALKQAVRSPKGTTDAALPSSKPTAT